MPKIHPEKDIDRKLLHTEIKCQKLSIHSRFSRKFFRMAFLQLFQLIRNRHKILRFRIVIFQNEIC